MIWLGFFIGVLGGVIAGLVIGSWFGRESMRDEIERRWWQHLREQRQRWNKAEMN